MEAPKLSATGVLAVAGLVVGGFIAWRAYRSASGAVSGAVDSVTEVAGEVWDGLLWFNQLGTTPGPEGNLLGVPEPEAVGSEPELARWIVDNFGTFEASKWVTMGALIRGLAMDEGAGKPPRADTEAGRYLLPQVTAAPVAGGLEWKWGTGWTL